MGFCGPASELHILATSREPLGITGESIWQVPPLAIPDPRTPATLATVSGTEAVRLFTDRARLALPDFRLSTANAAGVVRICQQLDGVPLALELAAARVRSLSIGEIAAHVSGSLELLVGGSRTAAPHQRTLQATLDWSYALLEPDEQSLFEQSGVFAGGWILEAAEVVCAEGIRPTNVVNLLARLVEKSLVLAEHRIDRRVRYRMLEVLRQYARDQLRKRDTASSPQRRHAEYFHRVIEGAGPELQPPHQGWWLNWCHEELDNLRAALDWAAESGNAGISLRIAANMRRYWFHVHQNEGRSRLESLLALPSAAADITAQADGLVALGMLTRERDELALARSYGEKGLALARAIGNPSGVFSALVTLSWTVAFQGEWDAAEQMLQECIDLAWKLGDLEVGLALGGIGTLCVQQSRDDEARSILEDSVDKLRAVGAYSNAAQYLCILADIALRQQQFEEADRHAADALSLAHGPRVRVGLGDEGARHSGTPGYGRTSI
ncbi:MAG: hypothetical protein M3069_17440 [Chloroflexota bacterium]|nr:hypothetical protein [Chloroflexota bacterium]